MFKLTRLFAVPVLSAMALLAPAAVPGLVRAGDPVGTSTEDLPSLQGEFAISNDTGHTIHYSVRWGNEEWKKITLPSGRRERHWYPLDGNRRAPTPQVNFDGVDHNHKRITYDMEFYAVGYQGFGSAPNLTKAKEYYFDYSSDGGSLDLYAR